MKIRTRIALAGVGMVAISLSAASALIYWVVTSEDRGAGFERTTKTLLESLLGLVVLGSALSLLFGLYLTKRALSPVQKLIQEVETANEMSRIEVKNPRDDVGKIAISLNELLDRIEKVSINQRRFTADAGHELRGPLTTIQLSIDTLRSRENSIELQDISKEITRLTELCNDLLDLSRVESHPITLEKTSLLQILNEQIKTFGQRNSSIEIIIDKSVDISIDCNSQLIGMAIRNLLENAIEHARTHVEISSTLIEDELHIIFRDDGPGVPLEEQSKIFERFYRLEDVRTNGVGGTGLGLSVVSAVMSAHGGKAICMGDAEGEFHLLFKLK